MQAVEQVAHVVLRMETGVLAELDLGYRLLLFRAGISVPQHAEHALDADTPSAPVYVPPFPNLLSGHVHLATPAAGRRRVLQLQVGYVHCCADELLEELISAPGPVPSPHAARARPTLGLGHENW